MPTLDRYRGSKWRGRIKFNGKEVTRLFGQGRRYGPEWKKALAWEEEARRQLESQGTSNGEPSPLDWGVSYLEFAQRQFAVKTFREKRSVMDRFLRFTAGRGFQTFTDQARLFLRPHGRSGNSVNKDRKNLSAAWQWGSNNITEFPAMANPFSCVPKAREERHDRYIPPEEDFWRVYDQATGQDKVLLLAFLHLGARRGELFRLSWHDVDLGRQQIRLSTRKTKDGSLRHDWLPVTSELLEAFTWWQQITPFPHEHVFVQLEGSPSPNNVPGQPFTVRQHFMGRLCRKAGVRPFGFHAIRHLTAVSLAKAGHSIVFIQKVLRHQTPRTTEVYLRSLGFGIDEMRKGLEVTFQRREIKEPHGGRHEVPMYTRHVHTVIH